MCEKEKNQGVAMVQSESRPQPEEGVLSLSSEGAFNWVALISDGYLLNLFHSENEGAGQTVLIRDQTDRPGHQQDLSKPRHVHGSLWSQVSVTVSCQFFHLMSFSSG